MKIRARMSMSADGSALTFERERALPGGSVEIVYAVGGASALPGRDAGWSPASQPR